MNPWLVLSLIPLVVLAWTQLLLVRSNRSEDAAWERRRAILLRLNQPRVQRLDVADDPALFEFGPGARWIVEDSHYVLNAQGLLRSGMAACVEKRDVEQAALWGRAA